MNNRLKGNLTIWGVLLVLFSLPIIVLGVLFNIKDNGWFWGSLQVLVAAYLILEFF